MSAPRVDEDNHSNYSDAEEETAIDDVNPPGETTGLVVALAQVESDEDEYLSEEFEEDEESPHSVSPSPHPIQSAEEYDEVARNSPFVPAESDASTSSPSSGASAGAGGGQRSPPRYTSAIGDPPTYARVSKRAVGDGGDVSSDSADEATAFLRSQRVVAAESASATGIELKEVGQRGGGRSPSPPPYDEAIARVGAGIAVTMETSFAEEVETRRVPLDEEARHIMDGRDVPPPEYVETRRHSLIAAQTGPEVDVEATGNTESAEERDDGYREGPCGRKMKRTVIIASVVVSLLVLFVALFPFQFSYVDYYQFALVRTKSTGTVSTDKVYEHGCFVLGADREFVYLNRSVQSIAFHNLSMFTRDNVLLQIDVKLYYFLKFEDVGKLWRDYAGKHADVISAAARTTIHNCAPRLSQEDYLVRRDLVDQLIHEALKEKFADWGITIPYFNYLNLHLPERILEKKLKLLLIRTDIEKELAYQQQRKVELGTELLTTKVIYQAKEAINNGTARASAIRTVASAEKSQHVDTAHAGALSSMMNSLNVTKMGQALSFYYLATLNTIDHYAGTVGYSKRGLFTRRSN